MAWYLLTGGRLAWYLPEGSQPESFLRCVLISDSNIIHTSSLLAEGSLLPISADVGELSGATSTAEGGGAITNKQATNMNIQNSA